MKTAAPFPQPTLRRAPSASCVLLGSLPIARFPRPGGAPGAKFSLKEFHNVVLHTGNVPVAVFEQMSVHSRRLLIGPSARAAGSRPRCAAVVFFLGKGRAHRSRRTCPVPYGCADTSAPSFASSCIFSRRPLRAAGALPMRSRWKRGYSAERAAAIGKERVAHGEHRPQ